jgi:thiol-disulfide isomerase/thioredoxin
MALTPSTMLELGTRAPDFTLTNAVDDRSVSLADFEEGPALLVMFICNHCPYVQHVLAELGRLVSDYRDRGLAVAAINFDSELCLAYRGQLDDSRPGNGIPVTGADLRAAIGAVLAGEPVSGEQEPSMGCNIKWKPGNEPDYS